MNKACILSYVPRSHQMMKKKQLGPLPHTFDPLQATEGDITYIVEEDGQYKRLEERGKTDGKTPLSVNPGTEDNATTPIWKDLIQVIANLWFTSCLQYDWTNIVKLLHVYKHSGEDPPPIPCPWPGCPHEPQSLGDNRKLSSFQLEFLARHVKLNHSEEDKAFFHDLCHYGATIWCPTSPPH